MGTGALEGMHEHTGDIKKAGLEAGSVAMGKDRVCTRSPTLFTCLHARCNKSSAAACYSSLTSRHSVAHANSRATKMRAVDRSQIYRALVQ